MKIKNIQEYRSFYKNEIRDLPTRDENFIGNFLVEKETGKKNLVGLRFITEIKKDMEKLKLV